MAEVERLVEFAQNLRAAGLRPGTGAVEDFCRAGALVGVGDLYWAGRATLVSRRDDIPIYDSVFTAYFSGSAAMPTSKRARLRLVTPARDEDGEGEAGEARTPRATRASRIELLRRKRFEQCTPEELAEIATLAEGLARSLPARRSRRRERARSGALDLRSTLRASLRTGGEPFERRFRARREQPRRLVLLLDVSGSMRGTSRGLLALAHAVVRAHPRTEVVCFGTRVTTVTRELRARSTDEALRRAGEAVADWEGGTRIGDSLKTFLSRSGHRGSARGAVVVLCSDGLETGDPEVLRTQMERLARHAHRVVWLNPLASDPAYEPLARGMQAALPYVDVFAAGDTLESVEAVARRLTGYSEPRAGSA